MNRRNKLALEIVLGVVLLIIMVFTAEKEGTKLSFLVYVTFVINGVAFYCFMIKSICKYAFSLEFIHNLFLLIFFWISPMIQIADGFTPWGLSYGEDYIFKANMMILVWCLLFNGGIRIAKNKYINFCNNRMHISVTNKSYIKILLNITIIITIIYIWKNGVSFGGFGEDNSVFNIQIQSMSVLVDHCLTGFVTFSTMFTIIYYKNRVVNKSIVIIQIVCLILVAFPLSISRYAAGSIYSCLLVHMFPSLKKGHKFILLFSISFMILFPLLGMFRYSSISEIMLNDILISMKSIRKYYVSGNFDAYQMIIATIKVVEARGYTWGQQLLGTFLFFVPRSMWQNKPVSTGTYIANELGLSFGNISCPINMEFYIDFGVFGYIFIAFLLGYIVSVIDNSYWKAETVKKVSILTIGYPFMVPFFLFMCRGSLMSTYSNFCAYIAMLISICKLSNVKIRIR